ncbi:acyltransferase [Myroides marinus]|uniref:acyltransferase n=1 Tax=Myroides marinus TaxID=703342 RepID=UPI0025751837|nr:acyltransferase [Myroides marinus]MDM1376770.1 acyltransferase [Myroides marinus]
MKKFYSLLFRSNIDFVKTIFLNLRCFPLKVAIKLPIYVFKGFRIVELRGEICLPKNVNRGMICLGQNIAGYVTTSPGALRLKKGGCIEFLGGAKISQGSNMYINEGARLVIGEDVKFGDCVKVICYKSIVFGKMTELTWESQITDFNSHFIVDLESNKILSIVKPISIGEYCWIGNRSSIMPGTILPNRVIVASNSLLNKNYDEVIKPFSIIGGMPAKLLACNKQRIYSQENEFILHHYFKNNDITYAETSITLDEI